MDYNKSQKQYNGQNWEIYITGYDKLTNNTFDLLSQNINTIVIQNNIECFSPKMNLKYFDIGGNLLKTIDFNNLIIIIDMYAPNPNHKDKYWEEQDKLHLYTCWIVQGFKTIYKKTDDLMYQFECSHLNKEYLYSTFNYATKKQNDDSNGTPQSPLEIIKKILYQDSKQYKCTYVNDTSVKINFITSQNMSIQDGIKYLLSRAVSPKDPPTYFVHNLKLNEAMLINNKNPQERLTNITNVFKIAGLLNEQSNIYSSTDKQLLLGLSTQACEIQNFSINAGVIASQYISNFNFHNFSQNERKWTPLKYNYEIISDIFNKNFMQKYSGYRSIFPVKAKESFAIKKYQFPNFNDKEMYNFLRQLQLTTNQIRFRTLGNITRDAGQYVVLHVSDENQLTKYQGLWNIYSCKHIWSGKMYYNEYICYRTCQLIPQWNITKYGTIF